MSRRCHQQRHSNDTQTMYHVLNCFQESLVEEILRLFWGNEKWGWGPTETEHSRAKICNACNFWINIFSCRFDVQRFTRQRDKNLLVRNKTINSNNNGARQVGDHDNISLQRCCHIVHKLAHLSTFLWLSAACYDDILCYF